MQRKSRKNAIAAGEAEGAGSTVESAEKVDSGTKTPKVKQSEASSPRIKLLDVQSIKDTIGFVPSEWQRDVLGKLKRFTKIVGGKRSGKSYLSSYLAFRELLASNRQIWVVAPTFELGTRVWDNIEQWARNFPALLKVRKMDPILGRSIENARYGSVVRLKSADNPKQLKGDAGDLLIVEEAGDMEDIVWGNYLEPFISQKRKALGGLPGRAVFIGNAAYRGHWFHRKWAEPQGDDDVSFHIPTAIEDEKGNVIGSSNPDIIGVDELQRIKRSNSARIWQQEWLAMWLSGSGEVFRNIDRCPTVPEKPPEHGKLYVMGLDLAKLQDWTVMTVIDRHTFEVVHVERFNQIDWSLQKLRIFETAMRYNNASVWVDATGIGDPIYDDLLRMGVNVTPYKLSNTSKRQLIEKLSIYIEQGRISLPENETLRHELEIFGYKQGPTGITSFSAPEGEHDDMVISLALAVWDLPENKAYSPAVRSLLQEAAEEFESETF